MGLFHGKRNGGKSEIREITRSAVEGRKLTLACGNPRSETGSQGEKKATRSRGTLWDGGGETSLRAFRRCSNGTHPVHGMCLRIVGREDEKIETKETVV